MGPLKNAKHEAFARALFEGKSQRIAYREAFPSSRSWLDSTVDSKSCELAKNEKVLGRLDELKNACASAKILDRTQRMELLSEIANNRKERARDRISATDILNKMSGDYVKKIEATVSTDTSEIANKVRGILSELSDGDSG